MARHLKGYARFLMKVFLCSHNKFRSAVLPVSILLIVTGCSGLTRSPVPIDRMDEAVLTGMPGVRSYWMKEIDPLFQQDIIQSVRDEPPDLFPRRADNSPVYSGLAISGGGANGAFGAGILCGW